MKALVTEKQSNKSKLTQNSKIVKTIIAAILDKKGEEVISERHQKDYKKEEYNDNQILKANKTYTDIEFDDI